MKTILTFNIICLLSVNVLALSQAKFVQRLQSVHPFFTQQTFDQQIDNISHTQTTANQDWILTSSVDSVHKLNTQTTNSAISVAHNLTTTGADVSISNIWKNGLVTDKLSLNYTQPLLKNANGINDQLANDLSNIQIDINTLKRIQNAESFVLSQLFKWVDLSYAQQQLKLSNQRLALANQELALIKEKFAQSVVDEVDVFLQEDAYQRALQKHIQAEQTLDLLKQELSIILDLPIKSVVSDYNLYELFESKISNFSHYLQENSTEVNIIKLEKTLFQRQLLSDKNNVQAQFDLKLSASNDDDDDWSIGLGMSYPLGGIEAKSALEKTQINLAKIKENAQEQLINLTIKASVLNKKIKHLSKLLNSYQARIKIAKSRALAEKNRYELGNSQLSFVISAQNNVHDVNLAYAQTAVNYQKAVLDFKAVLN